MKKIALIIFALAACVSLQAQTGRFALTGTVVSFEGEPIVGATVIAEGIQPTIATVTGPGGSYSLNLPSGDVELTFRSLGFVSHTVNVNNRAVLDITLQADETTLDDVVVMGYQTQRRVTVTGAVATVSATDLSRRDAPNLSTAIQGLMPGVAVVQPSGRPGYDNAEITVRGIGSINSQATPLVLIDGVEGNMNQVDINAVENISVLKDASAAIYGSRASNGVILVTTKRGSATVSKPQFSYNGYYALTAPTEMPKPIYGWEFMELQNIAAVNSGQNERFTAATIEDLRRYGPDNWNTFDTEWSKLMLKRYANMHRHSLSVSGGGGIASYYIDGSYQYQDGIIKNNDFSRKSLRANTDLRLAKWATLSVDIDAFGTNETRPSQFTPEEIIANALVFSPILPAINRDGTYGDGLNGINPYAALNSGGTVDYKVVGFGTKGNLVIKLPAGFEFKSMLSYRFQLDDSKTMRMPYDTYIRGNIAHTLPEYAKKGRVDMGWTKRQDVQFNASLGYKNSINKAHNISALAGVELNTLASKSFSGYRDEFIPGYDELGAGMANPNVDSSSVEWAMLSYYGIVNYNYKEKYMLEVTGRLDGPSRFTSPNRWGFYPGASAAWRISEEPFWTSVEPYVSNAKLRVSYGLFGNQWIGNYYPFTAVMITNKAQSYPLGWSTDILGSVQESMFNENISWETSAQANVGLDLGFLKNHLTLSVDLFDKKVSQLIQKPQIAELFIYSAPDFNIGKMQVRGYDISLTYQNSSRDGNWRYSVTGMFSDAQSKMVEIANVAQTESLDGLRPGEIRYALRGWKTDGFYKDQADIDASPAFFGDRTNLKRGDVKYHDEDGNGVVDYGDVVVLGDASPRYIYSLSGNVSWKNIDLSVFIQGVGERMRHYQGNGIIPFDNGRSMFEEQRDWWWTPETADTAKFPRMAINASYNYRRSDIWAKNAGYVRLKNVVLGYTLPENLTSRIGIERLRVYASGQNLLTFSKAYKGFDPEANNDNGSNFYPVMRVFTVGLDLRF